MNWDKIFLVTVKIISISMKVVGFILKFILKSLVSGNGSPFTSSPLVSSPLVSSSVAFGPGTHEAKIVLGNVSRTVRIYANNSVDAQALLETQYGNHSVISTPRNIGP